MARYYVAYTKNLCYKYKANVRSNATVFLVLNALFCLILPFILSYTSRGFWIKQFSYWEQPMIRFKYQYVIILEHRINEYFQDSLICTTYQPLIDSARSFSDRCSLFKVIESDENKDNKADRLNAEIEITNVTDVDITALHVFLIFDYKIYKECAYNTEIMTVLSYNFPHPLGRIDFISRIATHMKKPLDCKARHDTKPSIPGVLSQSFPRNSGTHYLTRILSSYVSQTISADVTNTYSVAVPKTEIAINEPFVITIDIRYDKQVITYKTRFWELTKWAWIQHLSILAICLFLSKKIKKFLFQNRILQTIKVRPEDDE